MKIIKKLYLSFALSLVTVLLICLPKTNAKFFYENYGIAWDNHFTSFSQLKEVFYIEDSEGDHVNELWGGIKSDSSTIGTVSKDSGDKGSQDLFNDGKVDDFYTFGPFSSTKTISVSDIRNNYSQYLIENLKGIELNVVNQTDVRHVICVKIYYYAPKIYEEDGIFGWGKVDDDDCVHLSFGIYNTILHKNNPGNNVIKGEFIANMGSDLYSDGEYVGLVEVPTTRTSGNDGSQFITSRYGTYYYPHRAEINPYHILYDSGKYTIGSGPTHTDGENTSGNFVSFKYPAHDNHATSGSQKYADDIMSGVNLEDFILDPSESGSFNLSLYFGNYGDTSSQSDSASFVTSLALIAIPESDIFADIEANGGTVPATA